MANTFTLSGSLSMSLVGNSQAGGDLSGTPGVAEALTAIFAAAGGSAPTLSGWVNGTITPAAGDWALGSATDPFGGMGDATPWPPGFDPAGDRVKALLIRNNDTAQTLTVKRAASNGADVFNTAGAGLELAPGDAALLFFKAGKTALAASGGGQNDLLTITVSGTFGANSVDVTIFYGP